jgi:hypothetical protein
MNRASWFLRAMPLLSGRAMAETQWDLQLLAGKWASPKFGLTPISSSINLRKGKKSVKIGNSRLSFILAEGRGSVPQAERR